MEFEWDSAKRISNLEKHGIDFADAAKVFEEVSVTVEDSRFNYGEKRLVTFGVLNERVIAVVHTKRENRTRIISARKATKHERANYLRKI